MKDYKFTINGNVYAVAITSIEENIAQVEVNGTPYKVEMDKPAKKQVRPLTRPQKRPTAQDGSPVTVSRPSTAGTVAGVINSPLPGVILDVDVTVGQTVSKGDKIATLEAMKMENSILADRDGAITEIYINKGDSVLEGAAIVKIG